MSRRRTRQVGGFGSDRGAANFHLLWMLKENARSNGRDYLREILPWTLEGSPLQNFPSINYRASIWALNFALLDNNTLRKGISRT